MTTETMSKQMTALSPIGGGRFPFNHAKETLKAGDVAIVKSSAQCYVMLMDDANLASFIDGHQFHYYGGFYKLLPAQIAAPSSGAWNVVVHLGGKKAPFAYSISFNKK